MLTLNKRLSNIEDSISYLYNSFEPAIDSEIEIVRKKIFNELNDMIQEVQKIKRQMEMLERIIIQINQERIECHVTYR